MSINIFVILAIMAGAGLPAQIGLNGFVSKETSPYFASMVSFLIGTIGMLLVLLVTKTPILPSFSFASIPAISWAAGLIGAFYVTASIISAPKIGVASFITLVIASQIIVSIIIDHYGLIGFKQNPITIGKVIGAFLLVIGVILIKKY